MTDVAPSHGAATSVLDGRYRLVECIGAGRAGPVWSAVDLRLRRAVAVRLVALAAGAGEAALAATASGWTPGMTRVFDAGTVVDGDLAGTAYLVREFADGTSLDARADAGGLPAAAVAGVGACVAGTLAGLHLLGLAHGSVHGGNIVVPAHAGDDADPLAAHTAALTDFGLRSVLGGSGADQAEDVRGLGEALLGVVTARRVVGSRTTLAALQALRREPSLRPRERRAWAEVLVPMTAPDPAARPSAPRAAAALAALARETAPRGSVVRARSTDQAPPWDVLFSA